MKRAIIACISLPALAILLALTPVAALLAGLWCFLLAACSYPLAILAAFKQEAAKW